MDLLCFVNPSSGENSYCQIDASDGFWERSSDLSRGLKVRFSKQSRKCEVERTDFKGVIFS